MINGEKYRDEILNNCNGEFGLSNRIVKCTYEECASCVFSNLNNQGDHVGCSVRRIKWLLLEYKEPIKLNKLEYDILKYLSDNTKHMYITRNQNGNIYVFDFEPTKDKYYNCWSSRGMHGMVMFNNLFQFVQWKDSEPTSIEDVLNNCEVFE